MSEPSAKEGARSGLSPRILGAIGAIGMLAALIVGGAYALGPRGGSDKPSAPDRTGAEAAAAPTAWSPLPLLARTRALEPAEARSERSPPLPSSGPEPTAQEHRDQSVAEIRASGPDRLNLTDSAAKVATGWAAKMATVGVEAEFGPTECHQKGCFVTLVHKSESDVDRGMQVMFLGRQFLDGNQLAPSRDAVRHRRTGVSQLGLRL